MNDNSLHFYSASLSGLFLPPIVLFPHQTFVVLQQTPCPNQVGVINVVATYVALQLMDKTGRVPLMLWSTGGMIASAFVVTLTLLGFAPNIVAVLAVMSFVSFFEVGLGPIPWLIVAEMFDAK